MRRSSENEAFVDATLAGRGSRGGSQSPAVAWSASHAQVGVPKGYIRSGASMPADPARSRGRVQSYQPGRGATTLAFGRCLRDGALLVEARERRRELEEVRAELVWLEASLTDWPTVGNRSSASARLRSARSRMSMTDGSGGVTLPRRKMNRIRACAHCRYRAVLPSNASMRA